MNSSNLLAIGVLLCIPSVVHSSGMEPPTIEWERVFGGAGMERGNSVQETADGGFVVVSPTGCPAFDFGVCQLYLVKFDENGNDQWDRTLGDGGGSSVQQTTDGGFIITGAHSMQQFGSSALLVKTSPNGEEQWRNEFRLVPGRYLNCGNSVEQTDDGGYVVAGYTTSPGSLGDFSDTDIYVIKVDFNGGGQWSRNFRDHGYDFASSIQQTDDDGDGQQDDGYVVVGSFLLKLDGNGKELWNRPVQGESVEQTSDGGFIVVGSRLSTPTGWDVHLVKTDDEGNEEWSNSFGGEESEWGYSVQETSDGGFIIVGGTYSFGAGRGDVYLIKTDTNGNEAWSKTLGGEEYEVGYSVQQTSEGGYVIAGLTEDSFGAPDIYLIKLTPDPVPFSRGRTNTDAELDISDAVCFLIYLFGPEDDPCKEMVSRCLDGADANDDGMIDIADGVSILSHLFASAGDLPEPFSACGYDETHDELRCFEFEACQ